MPLKVRDLIKLLNGSMDELIAHASEAIRLYWDTMKVNHSPTAQWKEIEVELTA